MTPSSQQMESPDTPGWFTSRPIADVARDIHVHEGTLGNWVRKHRAEHADGEPQLGISERTRLRELERENRELRMKAELLGRTLKDVGVSATETAGFWWLPDRPDLAAAGTLSVEPYGPVTLDLLGTWRPDEAQVRFSADPVDIEPHVLAALDPAARERADLAAKPLDGDRAENAWAFPRCRPVVHGVIHGDLVTLLDVQEVSRDALSTPGFARSVFSARAVLRGGHAGGWDDTVYSCLAIGFEHLVEWCDTALLDDAEPEPGNEAPLGPHRAATCTLPDGSEVRLGYRGGNSYSLNESRYWREPEFLIRPGQALALGGLLDRFVVPIRDLLTTATGTPCSVTRLQVTCGEIAWGGGPVPLDVTLADDRPAPTGRTLHPDLIPLSVRDVDYEAFLPAWFKVRDERSVAAQFAYAQRHIVMPYGEQRLLTATAGAEALHSSRGKSGRTKLSARPKAVDAFIQAFPDNEHALLRSRLNTLNNDPSLAMRLRELVDEAGDLFDQVAQDRGAWVKRVVEARNAVAHGNAKRPDLPQLVALAEGCGHLLELCLLLEAGANRAALRQHLPLSAHHRLVVAHTKTYLGQLP